MKAASRIMSCEACPRLRKHCLKVARIKRRAYRDETYWGKPITGFGNADAGLVIVGLAPAAHGANRTGRIFTGDRSGDWLYRALFRAGFANQASSVSRDDGLALKDAYVTCVVKCAPPDNKPSRAEFERCVGTHLKSELSELRGARVFIALGRIAFDELWPLLTEDSRPKPKKPKFSHGGEFKLPDGRTLLLSYHPSQQNTFTGRLTEPMFDAVFERAARNLSVTSPRRSF